MSNGWDRSSPGDGLTKSRAGGGIQIVVRPESFAATAAAFIARKLASWTQEAPMRVGLSGGGTPEPVYQLLALSPLPDWDRIEVYLADERAVPPDHEESNLRLIRSALSDIAGLPRDRVHGIISESDVSPDGSSIDNDALEAAARRYEVALPDRFDLLLLGLGVDGHTASLFPGEPSLREIDRRVVVARAPTEPTRRVTITPPMISNARLCIVLVQGATKARAVEAALSGGSVDEVPGRLAGRATWIIGADALGSGAT